MSENNNVPFQVEHLINSMMNKSENVHIRGNFRMRLESIRNAIDFSLKKYDNEMFSVSEMRNRKRK